MPMLTLVFCLTLSEVFLAKELVLFAQQDVEMSAEGCELHSVFKLYQWSCPKLLVYNCRGDA